MENGTITDHKNASTRGTYIHTQFIHPKTGACYVYPIYYNDNVRNFIELYDVNRAEL